jgi:hypothetical protein
LKASSSSKSSITYAFWAVKRSKNIQQRLTLYALLRYFSQPFSGLLAGGPAGRLAGRARYEAQDASRLPQSAQYRAMSEWPPSHPGEYLEQACVALNGGPKPMIRTRVPRTVPLHAAWCVYDLDAARDCLWGPIEPKMKRWEVVF